MDICAVFPNENEFEKAKQCPQISGRNIKIISPFPAYEMVGCPALIMDNETERLLRGEYSFEFICSGWVAWRGTTHSVPDILPECFDEDIFKKASVMTASPCMADETKIRLTAHISGNMNEAFPYMNAEMANARYNSKEQTFFFKDEHRIITLYPYRISVTKADDIIDGWRTLEKIRIMVNKTYAARAGITPDYNMHENQPGMNVYNIYELLPKTNCGICGQKTCMAFAYELWSKNASPLKCNPAFHGEYQHLKKNLLEACISMGIPLDS